MLLLFAPGAGAPSSSPWMQAHRRRLESIGRVVPIDYPYQLAGRRSPDRPGVLVEAHRVALETARVNATEPAVLIGKSMGGRIGCHVAVETTCRPDALVCLGYPLFSQSGALRDRVLLALETPILFVQGTRDPLCPLPALERVREGMKAHNELLVVQGGDHSLRVTRALLKAKEEDQEAVDARVIDAIAAFLGRVVRRP